MPLTLLERFIDSYDASIQARMQALVDAIKANHSFTDLEEFLTLSQNDVADDVAGLSSSNGFITGFSGELISKTNTLVSTCSPSDNIEERFYSMFGSGLSGGLADFVSTLTDKAVINDFKDLATASSTVISDELAGQTCNTPIVQDFSGNLLSDISVFLNDVTRVVSFTAAISPENKNYEQVYVKCYDEDNGSALLGEQYTTQNGIFEITYSETIPEDGAVITKDLKFDVFTSESEVTPYDTELKTFDPATESQFVIDTINIPAPADTSPDVSDLANAPVSLTFPAGFLAYLSGKGVDTLQDVREKGGIYHFDDIPGGTPASLIADIDDYASLTDITTDLTKCKTMYDEGYKNIPKIASSVRSSFVTAVSEALTNPIGSTEAASFYARAVGIHQTQNSMIWGGAIAKQNGFSNPWLEEVVGSQTISSLLTTDCNCDDCESGVSPLAYLSSLLKYAVDNVKDLGADIDINYLEDNFYQPFGKLSSDCDEVENKVCQIRVCIDVLRKYYEVNSGAMQADALLLLRQNTKTYLIEVYNNILSRIGTSYDELKNIPVDEKEAVANRLGIDENKLASLVLDIVNADVTSNDTEIVGYENDLEKLFGLPSTVRNPLSKGYLENGSTDIVRWDITGEQWGYNTDEEGYIHGELKDISGDYTINLYNSSTFSTDTIIATGKITTASGVVNLTPLNNSGVFGNIEIDFVAPDITTLKFSMFPDYIAWKLQKTNEGWQKEDNLTDSIFTNTDSLNNDSAKRQKYPYLDPDIVSLDDLRDPTNTTTDTPSEIWTKRKVWIDGYITELYNTQLFSSDSGPDVEDVYNYLKGNNFTYNGSTATSVWNSSTDPDNFEGWYKILTNPADTDYDTTKTTVKNDLLLEVDEFIRMYELELYLDKLGTTNTEYSLTVEQRANAKEFIDITIVSCKRKYQDTWIAEEQNNNIWLNQSIFYKALSEPEVGTWPTIIQPYKSRDGLDTITVPLIEPGFISLAAMVDDKLLYHLYQLNSPDPDSVVYQVYNFRKEQIATDLSEISEFRKVKDTNPPAPDPGDSVLAYGFEQLLQSTNTSSVIGDAELFKYSTTAIITTGTSYQKQFLSLIALIENGDEPAIDNMQAYLYMTVDEFKELADYYLTCIEQGLSDAQWQSVYALMQVGLKRAYYYSDWNNVESNWESVPTISLKYWEVQKQKLVKWRADESIRKEWVEYLERSTELPSIDPDYIFYSNFIDPRDSDGAGTPTPFVNIPFTTWKDRKTIVDGWRSGLSNNIGTYLTYLGDVYENYTPIDLYTDYLNNGKDISPYVTQLNLTVSQLEILFKLNTQYSGGAITDTSDQENAQDVMLTVYKRRNSSPANANWAGWHRQEAIDSLYISPQIFALPPDTSLSFNLAVQDSNTRLVNPATKLEWQQKLTARISEQNFIIQSQNDLIDVVKDEDQMQLRDALVTSLNKFGFDTVKNAEWVHDKLLIDAKTNCCSPTTRIAQALETLQVFLFGLRHGQLANDYPDLTLDNDYFDEHWRWLGTYSNWRSLMFSYLYPENLLDPTFRDHQTGKFREITDAIVGNSRFNPKFAEEAAQQYKEYFQDVTHLDLASSVSSNVVEGVSGKYRTYNIARNSKTGNVYWNSYDLVNTDGDIKDVTTWEPIPGFQNTKHIAGATAFTVKSGTPYIYVMATLTTDKSNVIRYNRYNLTELTWDTEATELELDKKFDTSTAVLETVVEKGQVPFMGIKWNKDEADTERLYVFQFNEEGKALEDEFRALTWLGKVYSLTRVKSHTSVNGDEEFVYCWADAKKVEKKTNSNQLVTGFFKATPTKAETGEEWYANRSFAPTDHKLPTKGKTFIGGIYQYKKDTLNRMHSYFKSKEGAFYFIQEITFNTENEPEANTPYEKADRSDRSLQYIGPVWPVELNPTNTGASITVMGGIEGKQLRKGIIEFSSAPATEGNKEFFALPDLNPVEKKGIDLKQKNTPNDLQARRNDTHVNLEQNSDTHHSQWVYLTEYYYYMPMLLAIQLQKNRFYTEALDWYKVVFDYSADIGKRKIYYGLILEENVSKGNILKGNVNTWLTSPTDPHAIAALRPNNFTRFTVYSIVQCLMDFADNEYTRDTAESVPRARTLYDLALELLNEQVFNQQAITCDELIDGLDYLITDVTVWDTWLRIKNMLRESDSYEAVYTLMNSVDGSVTVVIKDDGSTYPDWETKFERVIYLIQDELKKNTAAKTTDNVLTVSTENEFKFHLGSYASSASSPIFIDSGNVAVDSFSDAISLVEGGGLGMTPPSDPDYLRGPWAVDIAYDVLDATPYTNNNYFEVAAADWKKSPEAGMVLNQSVKTAYLPLLTNYYCVVPNPIPDYMRMHAEIQLLKIRNCLSISGLKRELDPYAAPIDATSGIPSLIGGGRLNTTTGVPRSATIYRYQFLVERAKQLVSYAQQMESSLLSALEKRDAEYYTVMKARQDLSISKANVKLGDLRLDEAESGVTLAQYQLERSEKQVSGLQGLIDAGLNKYEKGIIDIKLTLATVNSIIQIAQATADSTKVQTLGAGLAALSGGVSTGLSTASSTARWAMAIAGITRIGLNTAAEISSIYAAQARREQEWNYQKTLAEQDVKIGNQQIRVAENRVKVVGQEKQIAEMQNGFAEDTLNFLSSKFTNVQLYEWMVRILQRTYDNMLQQATATAKLAQLQLAFERQEGSSGIIQDDYWEAPADASGNTGPDRRGLTGSTRLLGDIVKLESYAIETNQRKLQLTKTISLATYFPIEFQQFRETGQFNFTTTLEHFNRDFPGHYLRLIKSVRTSVIALTPPNEGIKATLANTGNSTVVVKANSTFPEVKVSKLPESVALTSPYNASGMFELQQQDPTMYLPFEGSGVETMWFFEMLKANNPFDFNTIADVILTIEYTALEDYNYKVRRMNGNNATNADGSRLFSMRNDFADQWYDLSNGELEVSFDISQFNFPANTFIEPNGTAKIYVSFGELDDPENSAKKEQIVEVVNAITLSFNDKALFDKLPIENEEGTLPQQKGFYAGQPFGKWKLKTEDTYLKDKIKYGIVQDVLFVVDYKANTAAYPKLA